MTTSQKLKTDDRIPLWGTILLSLFVVYHVATVLVLPNPSSSLSRQVSRFMIPYANQFSLNTTWQFFSPGPVPIFYFEYDIETSADLEAPVGDAKTHTYPDRLEPRSWGDFGKRRRASASLFAMSSDWVPRYLARYICGLHPGAVALNIRVVLEPTTEMQKLTWYSRENEMSQRIDMPRFTFSCDHEGAP
jgi:hypothetical protein